MRLHWLRLRGSRLVATLVFGGLAIVECGTGQTTDPLSERETTQRFHQVTSLPGARQRGVGCAFYGNVPALTFISGIHVVDDSKESKSFVSDVYGLRKGDFKFRSAYDKKVFFELFGIPTRGATRYYSDLGRRRLLKEAEGLINGVFVPALDRGSFISLRVCEPLGRPHNVLVVAHRNGIFWYHDSIFGTINTIARTGLTSRILTESKLEESRVEKPYFSAWHLVSAPGNARQSEPPLRLDQLPDSLEIRLSKSQLVRLAKRLRPAVASVDFSPEGMVKAYPAIDFAVTVTKVGDEDTLVSVVSEDLAAGDLRGLAQIAKLAVNSFQIGKRDLLSVWMVENRPRLVTGYYGSSADGDESGLILFDGKKTERMALKSALMEMKKSGQMFGYLDVPRDQ